MDNTTQAQAANEPITEGTAQADVPSPVTPLAQRDQLEKLLENPDWQPETTSAPAEADGAEMAIDEPRAAGEQPPREARNDGAEEPEGEEQNGSSQKGGRFRFSDPADRQFAVLRKEGVAPEEAARIAYGIVAAAKGSAGRDDNQAETADPLTALEQELVAVDQQLKAAAEAGSGLIDGDVIALIQKRSDLAADIKAEARLRGRESNFTRQQAEAEAKARQARQGESVQAAAQRFPLLATAGSPLRVEAEKLLAMHRGSPFLEDPDAPIVIAEQAATNVARAHARAHGTSFEEELRKIDSELWADKGQAPGKQLVHRKITPASGAHGTQRPDKPATERERFSGITTLDPREKRAALEEMLYGG